MSDNVATSWRVACAGVLAAALLCPAGASANDDVWGSVRLIGGAAAARRVASIGAGPRQKTSVVIDLARWYFSTSAKGSPDRIGRFARYLEYLLRVEQSLQDWPDGLTLAAATGADRRRQDAFREAVELLGLRVRAGRDTATVELDRGDEATERREWLIAARIDTVSVAEQLNKGGSARIVIPSDEVPLPLPALWTSAVFRKDQDALVGLVSAPQSLFMYLGLMDLDTDTLAWFGAHPDVFRYVYENRFGAFGAFAQALRIEGNRIVTPGGDAATPIWEALVEAPVADPGRFIDRLFEKNEGRLAYFYATVAHADRPRQDFLLGTHFPDKRDGRDRLRYVETVRDWFVAANPHWNVQLQPLFRPAIDPSLVVLLTDVDRAGLVGPDWWPSVFERVAAGGSWPKSPNDTLRRLKVGFPNATWLLHWIFERPEKTEERWRIFRFAQRQLLTLPKTAAHDAEVTLRALQEMPVLIAALERMGVTDPALYAEVSWAAKRIESAGTPDDTAWLLRTWQGAFGALEQIARHRPIAGDVRTTLLQSLARAVPARPNAFTGNVPAWVIRELLPALHAAVEPADDMEADVFRKIFADEGRAADTFTWEGVAYRVDTRGPTSSSALAIRAAMEGPRLQDVARLLDVADRLAKPPASLAELSEIASRLEAALCTVPSEELGKSLKALREIKVVKNLPRATRERPKILTAVDLMAADLLPSVVYALAMSPTTQPVRLFSDAARLHELVARENNSRWISFAWKLGEVVPLKAGGTAVRGSLLGLDLARAWDHLSRAPGETGIPSTTGGAIHELTGKILVDRIVIRGVGDWHKPGAAVAAAIARGRERASSWKTALPAIETWSGELARAGMGQSRQNQLRWLLERKDPAAVDTFLSVTDFYRLGSTEPLPAGWGQSGRALDGCWCVRGLDHQPLERFRGYTVGYVAAVVSDLPLRLAEVLEGMKLPLTVIEPMLPLAVQDVVDQAVQFLPDDWEPLARAGRITPERVENYLHALITRQILAPPAEGR